MIRYDTLPLIALGKTEEGNEADVTSSLPLLVCLSVCLTAISMQN